jgi:hypothetical protein
MSGFGARHRFISPSDRLENEGVFHRQLIAPGDETQNELAQCGANGSSNLHFISGGNKSWVSTGADEAGSSPGSDIRGPHRVRG